MMAAERRSTYEQACALCIDDLYRIAYLALIDSKMAEKMVTRICTAGAYKYGSMKNKDKIKFRLTADLYRRCRRKLWFFRPSTSPLPDQLQALTSVERLLMAMRFASGLTAADSGKIVGMSQENYRKVFSDIMRK